MFCVRGLDGELLAEADGATGKSLRLYVWLPAEAADGGVAEEEPAAPLPLALVTGPGTAGQRTDMVHADHLGRPVRLTDEAAATVWQASYDPFGLPLAVTGTVEQNLRFPGQYFLLETGLAYNWHRLYDPATGRYTQPDPLRFVDGPSVYGYAGASPLMSVDPTGQNPALVIVAACEASPALCAATAAVVARYALDACKWTASQMSGDGGSGGREKTPNTGEPGSTYVNPGNGQIRKYGDDGKPTKDIDSNHDHGEGVPHVHDWDRDQDGKPIRGPGRPPNPSEL